MAQNEAASREINEDVEGMHRVDPPGRRILMAPSFAGRTVPAGEHTVRFVYEPFPRYDIMLLIGLLALIGLAVVPGRLRSRHARAA